MDFELLWQMVLGVSWAHGAEPASCHGHDSKCLLEYFWRQINMYAATFTIVFINVSKWCENLFNFCFVLLCFLKLTLLGARHFSERFTYINPFSFQSNSMIRAIIKSLRMHMRNWGPGKLSNLPKVTQHRKWLCLLSQDSNPDMFWL